jgi:hypothetical protein
MMAFRWKASRLRLLSELLYLLSSNFPKDLYTPHPIIGLGNDFNLLKQECRSNRQEDKMTDISHLTDISNLRDKEGNRVDQMGFRIITFDEAKELVAQGRAKYNSCGLDPQCKLEMGNSEYVAVHFMPFPGYRQLDKPNYKAESENKTR